MESFKREFAHLEIQLENIKLATNNFDEAKVIGRGGFGKVYEGELSHFKGHSKVAIKRLDRQHGQGGTEFWKEIKILNRHMHENLIALLGFCIEGGEMILVYEYASNGSLDLHIGSTDFTWTQRLKTCLAAARGLSFLHDARGTGERVIHRDVKCANILLDTNWNTKVADMGLSRLAPANQPYTGVYTNLAGTHGYCDPLYMETNLLKKETDIYSFGVVLFEVLCGRLCFDHSNGRVTKVIVPVWKESYERNKLKEIIFGDLKQQMDENSLKTYSEIAYKCLKQSYKERPTMPHVVKELETALTCQEDYESQKLPRDKRRLLTATVSQNHLSESELKAILRTAAAPLNYRSESELKMLLLKGILINNGKTWFSRNMNGDHGEMISIAACLTSSSESQKYISSPEYNSRFAVGCYEPCGAMFETHVRTEHLSPKTTYTINLVFKRKNSEEQYIGLEYKLKGDKERSYSFVSDKREDGWLSAELFQFTSDKRTIDLKILFYTKYCDNLLVEGIEFQPVENVQHEELRDDNVGILPNDYGRRCLMPAEEIVLNQNEWDWKLEPQLRSGQVAYCITEEFGIDCQFKTEMLSLQTAYAAYLVYKLPHEYNYLNPPVQVVDDYSDSEEATNIFLRTPETPVIRENLRIKSPSIRPRIKGLPKPRSDGWIEVQVHEFQTPTANRMMSLCLRFSSFDKPLLKGITVQGLELRPI